MRNNRILKVSIIVAIMTIMLLCLTNNVFAADNARVFSTNFSQLEIVIETML